MEGVTLFSGSSTTHFFIVENVRQINSSQTKMYFKVLYAYCLLQVTSWTTPHVQRNVGSNLFWEPGNDLFSSIKLIYERIFNMQMHSIIRFGEKKS